MIIMSKLISNTVQFKDNSVYFSAITHFSLLTVVTLQIPNKGAVGIW